MDLGRSAALKRLRKCQELKKVSSHALHVLAAVRSGRARSRSKNGNPPGLALCRCCTVPPQRTVARIPSMPNKRIRACQGTRGKIPRDNLDACFLRVLSGDRKSPFLCGCDSTSLGQTT